MKSSPEGSRIVINSLTETNFYVCQFTNLQWEICQADINARAGIPSFALLVGRSDTAKLISVAWRAWSSKKLMSALLCCMGQNTHPCVWPAGLYWGGHNISISNVFSVKFPCTLPTIDLMILSHICQSDMHNMKAHCCFNLYYLGTTNFRWIFFHILYF